MPFQPAAPRIGGDFSTASTTDSGAFEEGAVSEFFGDQTFRNITDPKATDTGKVFLFR